MILNMNNLYCKQDVSLTDEEKETFLMHLKQQELSDNIWDLFQIWVDKSTTKISFFYLKVYNGDELIGLGLFIRIKPFDMRTSYSMLRSNIFLSKIFSAISAIGNNCVYISLRNLITSNITRPFFYKDPAMGDVIMQAILNHLKNDKKADMISILDTTVNDNNYQISGYNKFPCSSEGSFDAARYNDVSEYLDEHKNLKKNLKRRNDHITTEILRGPISAVDKEQMRRCLDCSIENSRVYTPSQKFIEDTIFETEVFNSDKYIHFLIRVENIIAGFHIFHISGLNMGGILGGFNRDYSHKNYVYERIMTASLDYAIQNKIKRVYYSLIDNYTKLRLVNSLEPAALYFYSRNPVNQFIFKFTYKYNDVNKLSLLEKMNH